MTDPLADAVKAGRIRDPVHGYLPFTRAEALLLNEPVVQRLRYVRQSAAAHLVFPGMNVNRFEHSLGAMHVSSRLFAASLTNAQPELRDELLHAFRNLVGHQVIGIEGDQADIQSYDEHIQGFERTLRRQGSTGIAVPDARDRVASMVVEQALRFASLLHDLGHLPFSHDFELVLRQFFTVDETRTPRWPALSRAATDRRKPLHEHVGQRLATWLADTFGRSTQFEQDPEFRIPVQQAAALAGRIITSREPEAKLRPGADDRALRWLYQLVAGEIDADRCDYVLRDATQYGLPGATFDLDRLISSVTIAAVDGRADPPLPPEWETAVLPSGVSAAEEFLIARFRLYQWAVYHHKVQQAAASLRAALLHLLDRADNQIRTFLDDLNGLVDGGSPLQTEIIQRLVRYDDLWWTERFKEELPPSNGMGADPQAQADIRAFVYRGPGRTSLWKKPTDLRHDELRQLNDSVPDSADAQALWQEKVAAIEQEYGVTICVLPFRPFRTNTTESERPESTLRVVMTTSDGTVVDEPLTLRSAMVESLWEAWQRSLQILAFAPISREGRSAAARGTVLARLLHDNPEPGPIT